MDAEDLGRIAAHHVHETLAGIPGAWVVRGSGQEHQTAIRSPVLGGGGGCGGFLPLEDGVPVRPAVFCNINQFIELYTEEATAIEVIRGPSNALYGSNALHGTVNVLMPSPGTGDAPRLGIEAGSNRYLRGSVRLPATQNAPWLVAGTYAHDGGFRDDSGYEQGKWHFKRRWVGARDDFTLGFTATWLDQQSAGFIEGKDAYRDPAVNRTNPDPDAFRNASSQRLYGLWTRETGAGELNVRPFLRHSRMEFMHYERPGKPIERNGHHSAGAVSTLTWETERSLRILGFDIDLSESSLLQIQEGPAEGGPRQRAIFPEGKHYDYRVRALTVATYLQAEWNAARNWTVGYGARLEYTEMDYENRMLAGNTRDDGTPCGFGGCVYSRPADRSDSFLDFSPNLSVVYRGNTTTSYFARLARGFRVPQALELYRLQNGQQVSDLDTETLDSLEAGLRRVDDRVLMELTAYAMRKRDSVFVDSEGYNVSGARSRHHGVEGLVDWRFAEDFRLRVNAAYGRHVYDFDAEGRGSVFVSGNDIDSAPRWLGKAALWYEPDMPFAIGAELTSLGRYYLESLNRFSYPGHTVVSLRASFNVTPDSVLVMRVNNMADRQIADRADYARSDYRYLPGRGREWFIQWRYWPGMP